MKKCIYFTSDSKFSNFHLCKVVVDGLEFSSSEAAFQSQKFNDEDIKKVMSKLLPKESKRVNREFSRFLRPDWEDVKYHLMKKVVMAKFSQNLDCRQELLATGDAILIEDTTAWHDNTWGSCDCPRCRAKAKKNYLGKILMEVRQELSSEEKK